LAKLGGWKSRLQTIRNIETRGVQIVEKYSKENMKSTKKSTKVGKVMHEWKENKLHSGSKKGPKVKSKSQAIAIALSETRKSGAKIAKKKRR
jgi:hypothetical protein